MMALSVDLMISSIRKPTVRRHVTTFIDLWMQSAVSIATRSVQVDRAFRLGVGDVSSPKIFLRGVFFFRKIDEISQMSVNCIWNEWWFGKIKLLLSKLCT